MRLFISLCVFIFIAMTSQAQVKIGLRVSPQMTWGAADNKNTSSNGTRINMAYGIMVDYYFTDNYALGTEFCVNTYGVNLNLAKDRYTSVTFPNTNTTISNADDIKYNYQLQYFQIPILLKMRTKEIGFIRYYAEFGFGMGFLYKSKADINFGSTSLKSVNINNPDQEDSYTIKYNSNDNYYSDDVSSFRGSMIIGAGLQYNMHSSSMLVVGLRYDNGLTSFTDDDKWKTNLNYIALNLGLLF